MEEYVKLTGDKRQYFPISDKIFDVGDYIFVPRKMYVDRIIDIYPKDDTVSLETIREYIRQD